MTSAPPATVSITTKTNGALGDTVVSKDATLQLMGGHTFTTERLTLNGPGFNGAGALESVTSAAANVWDNLILLASASAIGVDADPAGGPPGLTADQAISSLAPSTDLS